MELENVFVNLPVLTDDLEKEEEQDQELEEAEKELEEFDEEDVSSISQEETYKPLPVILTRYLYIKQDVLITLLLSVTNKDWQQSLFWVCELYYSGFQEELVDFVWVIFRDCFQKYNPKMTKYMQRHYDQAMTVIKCKDAKETSYSTQPLLFIANMVRNMTVSKRYVDTEKIVGLEHYVKQVKPEVFPPVEPRIYVTVQESDLAQHKTLDQDNDLEPRKVLKQVCKYATNKSTPKLTHIIRGHDNYEKTDLVTMHRYCWLYYACKSPIWADRLKIHHGKLDDDVVCVVFDDCDDEEAFYEKYEYEPDEQSISVQTMFMHL